MANINRPGFFYAYRETAGPAPVQEFYTTSNVTLAKGDLVVMSATGYINLATTTADSLIVGVAAHAVTGATGVRQKVMVFLGLSDVVFVGQTSGTAAQADVGELVDFEGGTGAMEINENTQTLKQLRVIGIVPGESLDSNCDMYVKINKFALGAIANGADVAG